MSKICVLIRVYNRIEDLKYCIDIIRDTWKLNDYYIIVVANGENYGYVVDDRSKSKIDVFINLTDNVGHFHGNSQLLLSGLKFIPAECAYTLILEADTWMYGDEIINKYIKKMQDTGAVWASAQFFRYIRNLATDIAIVNTAFVKTNTDIFTFSGTPEYYVANYLYDHNFKYLYITENMPVNMPIYLRRFPYAPTGRFFTFLNSKMVTHHIEDLKGGMDEKKYFLNVAANKNYFELQNNYTSTSYKLERFKITLSVLLSYLIPYKSWFFKQKTTE